MLRKLTATARRLLSLDRALDEVKINQGRILAELHREKRFDYLWDYEFKIFSQWGEDGILQHLTHNLQIRNRTFIEFGVEDFFESNCRFLLMKDIWQGYVVDGSATNVERLKSSYFYWKYPLKARASFITRENVVELLEESGFEKDIGILAVDIDGVDYFVLDQLSDWRPCILIVEYNGIFGRDRAVSVPYDAEFYRTNAHTSNLYYGASLRAFQYLAERRGYALVGVNSVGSNAFFVRRELLNDTVQEVLLERCYRDSCFREGRDANGNLTFLAGRTRRSAILDLPLVDVMTGEQLRVGDLGE